MKSSILWINICIVTLTLMGCGSSSSPTKKNELSEQSNNIENHIKKLSEVDSKNKKQTIEKLTKIGRPAIDALKLNMKSEDIEVRLAVVPALGSLAKEHDELVSYMITLFQDKEEKVRSLVAKHLATLEPNKTLPLLLSELKNASILSQHLCIKTLNIMGKKAIGAEKALTSLFQSSNDLSIRKAICTALGRLGHHVSQDTVYALISVLEHGKLAPTAVQALAEMGLAASPLLVTAMMSHDSDMVRENSVIAIQKMKDHDTTVIPNFVILITEDSSPSVRRQAIQSLGIINSSQVLGLHKVLPALTEALSDEVWEVRLAAVRTLGIFGSDAAKSISSLNTLLFEAKDEKDIQSITTSLAQMGKQAVPKLIDLLKLNKEKSGFIITHATEALATMGNIAVPSLIEALENEQAYKHAASALVKIGTPAIPRLIEALSHDEKRVYEGAQLALKNMGKPAVEPIIALFQKGFTEENDSLLSNATIALSALGPKAKVAVPTLVKIIQDTDYDDEFGPLLVTLPAIEALGEIGVSSDAVMKVLIEVLNKKLLANTAVLSLDKLAPHAKTTIPTLIKIYIESNNDNQIKENERTTLQTNILHALSHPQYDHELMTYLKRTNKEESLVATTALVRLGANAAAIKFDLFEFVSSLNISETDNSAHHIAHNSILVLGAIGNYAAPELVKLLTLDEPTALKNKFAEDALVKQGKPAVIHLIAYFKMTYINMEHKASRTRVIRALRNIQKELKADDNIVEKDSKAYTDLVTHGIRILIEEGRGTNAQARMKESGAYQLLRDVVGLEVVYKKLNQAKTTARLVNDRKEERHIQETIDQIKKENQKN